MKSKQWKKEGNVAVNLSIDKDVAAAVQSTVGIGKRSQLTQRLWMAWLRSKKVKLPPTCAALFKNGKAAA